MKQIYKYLAAITVALCTSLSSFGFDVCVDGIFYDLLAKAHEAKVVRGINNYSGNIVIPATIKVEGVDYNVMSIGESAFIGCYNLTSITIPNSVTTICKSAFNACYGLTSISIPNSVTSIESEVFASCHNLTSISIPNSVTSIGDGAFRYCSGLTSISIPNSVTSISGGAFYGCSGLTSISIPNSVTSIGENAFHECSNLTSISIGKSVSIIYTAAFSNCKNLEELTCYAENVPFTFTGVFTDSYVSYATLKVPEASIDKYKADEQWKDFGTIVGMKDGAPETKKCSKPSIAFENNRLVYSTDTDGADIVSKVTVADAKTSYDKVVELTGIYEITAYATKSGWNDSEAATATLVWLNGSLTGTSNNSKIEGDAKPVLISSTNGAINVTGLSAGDIVEVYTSDGKLVSTTTAMGVTATCIADSGINIVKIGSKRVKVVVK